VQSAYPPDTYARLAAVKDRYDHALGDKDRHGPLHAGSSRPGGPDGSYPRLSVVGPLV
jgi:hypothetical protein